MKKSSILFLLFLLWSGGADLYAVHDLVTDRIIMKDGRVKEGLIIKNDATEVILQQSHGNCTIKREDIARIDDANKNLSYFSDLTNRDKAPPWRMMVQDMRCNDAVKSFIQIPATRISGGYLKNVPYLSFHINESGEMNIYGNPKDPACVELGIYARGERLKRFQEIARQFFAGYIGSRSDLATLYHLNLSGDEQRAGKFIYKVQPSSDPQSYGAWWLSIYDPVRLKRDRVSDALYNKMTLPSDKIREKDGKLQRMWEEQYRQLLNYTMTHLLGKSPNFHGFYRDSQNRLQLLKTASN
jgi:hypothetical protein